MAVSCFGKLGKLWFTGKSSNLIITGMHLQKRSCILCHCVFIILQICAVSSSYLHKHSSTLAAHIRNPEFASDLNQLPPGYDSLPAGSQGCQHNQHCRCIIIHRNSCFCSCKPANILFEMIVSAASFSIFQVHLQIGISGHQRYQLRYQSFTQGSPAKIRMKDHTCTIDHALHPLLAVTFKRAPHLLPNILHTCF